MNCKAFFFLSLFYCSVQLGWGLKCHVCSTSEPGQDDCITIDPTVTKYLQDCPPGLNATCRIQEQWVDFEVLKQKKDKRTVRQCASTPFDTDRPCYYRAGFGGKTNVCNCLGDGCNTATGIGAPVALLGTLATLLLLKYLH